METDNRHIFEDKDRDIEKKKSFSNSLFLVIKKRENVFMSKCVKRKNWKEREMVFSVKMKMYLWEQFSYFLLKVKGGVVRITRDKLLPYRIYRL